MFSQDLGKSSCIFAFYPLYLNFHQQHLFPFQYKKQTVFQLCYWFWCLTSPVHLENVGQDACLVPETLILSALSLNFHASRGLFLFSTLR